MIHDNKYRISVNVIITVKQ